jgi:hypothetical protein
LDYIRLQPKGVPYHIAYQFVHQHFTKLNDFEGMIKGCVSARLLSLENTSEGFVLKAISKQDKLSTRGSSGDYTRGTQSLPLTKDSTK